MSVCPPFGENVYAYALGRPLVFVDPSGLGPAGAQIGQVVGGVIGAVGGAVAFGGGEAVGGTFVVPGVGTVVGGVHGAILGAGLGAVAGATAVAHLGSALEDWWSEYKDRMKIDLIFDRVRARAKNDNQQVCPLVSRASGEQCRSGGTECIYRCPTGQLRKITTNEPGRVCRPFIAPEEGVPNWGQPWW